jgi:hypothetical protein
MDTVTAVQVSGVWKCQCYTSFRLALFTRRDINESFFDIVNDTYPSSLFVLSHCAHTSFRHDIESPACPEQLGIAAACTLSG